jgi:hypothetical protein
MGYMSADELASLIGCRPNSYACMRRWLTRNKWPFETNLRGFPSVSRLYHDARMAGAISGAAPELANEPDFGMFSQ